jgi:S-adenosylmethionine:diacylglycerol 3-amino-3-carboxypropyl transferase
MYEDADIEAEAFAGKQRVFCIASAGDTAMLLSQQHQVIACDINPAQITYAQRRIHIGYSQTGDADRFMAFARRFQPLIGWRKQALREFIAISDLDQQVAFWRNHFDTARFRISFDTLLSRAILHIVYARQLLLLLPAHFGRVLRKRLERGIAHHPNATNPYIANLLLGVHLTPPPANPKNIQLLTGDAATVLDSLPPGSIDAFTLSNILDGTNHLYRERLGTAVQRAASKDAVVIWRSFAEPANPNIPNHARRDRAMLWGTLHIQPAEDFLLFP